KNSVRVSTVWGTFPFIVVESAKGTLSCCGRELTGFVHALTQTNYAHSPMQVLDPSFGVLCNQYSHRVGSSINGGHWSGPCFSMLDRVCFACTAQPIGVPR